MEPRSIPRLAAALLVLILAAGAAFLVIRSKSDGGQLGPAIGDGVTVTAFARDETPTGRGLVSVPVARAMEAGTVRVSFGTSTVELPVAARTGGRLNVPVRGLDAATTELEVRVRLSSGDAADERTFLAPVTKYDLGNLIDLAAVTKPEESMKGVATAQEPAQPTLADGTADITQRPAECAPTGAANSIIGLAQAHGESSKLPGNPMDLVDQLKGEMNWTPADGVVPEDFVAGKNRAAAQLGLPIRTELIGDRDGASTFEQLQQTLAKGGAAELRIRFTVPGGRKVIGGHLVTVVAATEVNGDQYIDVHDPATPDGTETYRVEGNNIPDYAVFEGDTYLGVGFAQYWEPVTGTSLEPMTDAEVRGIENAVGQQRTIKVIVVNGKKIPMEQVHIGKGPECIKDGSEMPHYHANNGQYGIALDDTKVRDPGGCGFGMAINVPVEDVVVN